MKTLTTLFIISLSLSMILGCGPKKQNTENIQQDTLADNQNEVMDEKCPDSLVYTVGMYSYTELGLACSKGDLETVKDLIRKGACKKACMSDDLFEFDLLYTAIMYQQEVMLKYCISIGMDVNRQYDENGITALTLACMGGNTDIAIRMTQILIEAGAGLNGEGDAASDYTIIPLFEAVRRNNLPLIKLLVEKGADVKAKNKQGETLFTIIKDWHGIDNQTYEYIKSLPEYAEVSILSDKWQGTYTVSVTIDETTSVSYTFVVSGKQAVLATNTNNASIQCNGAYQIKEANENLLLLTYAGKEKNCSNEQYRIKYTSKQYFIKGVGSEATKGEWIESKKN